MYRILVVIALVALVGCQTLPQGWDSAKSGNVEIVMAGLAQIVQAIPEHSETAKVRGMLVSAAAIAASNYIASDGTLSKTERLEQAVKAAEHFAQVCYSDVLAGRSLGDVIAASVTPYISLKAAGIPTPTPAEALIGLTLYGVKAEAPETQ